MNKESVEHIENNSEYKGLKVNKGIQPPEIVNYCLRCRRLRRIFAARRVECLN